MIWKLYVVYIIEKAPVSQVPTELIDGYLKLVEVTVPIPLPPLPDWFVGSSEEAAVCFLKALQHIWLQLKI